MEQATSAINALDFSLVGHTAISMSEWDTALEPEIAAGSALEIGGSIFYAMANDDIDVANFFPGVANSTLVFIMYGVSGTTATAELTLTAPVWDTAKQGWYNAAMTKRYIGSIYKDAGGLYTQKTIFLNRESGIIYQGVNLGGNSANSDKIIRLATDASISWDEANDEILINKKINNVRSYKDGAGAADVLLAQQVGAGTSAAFTIMKPISVRFSTGSTGLGVVQIQSSIGWATFSPGGATQVYFMMNPGTYRLYNNAVYNSALYALGVFGLTSITAADIVT